MKRSKKIAAPNNQHHLIVLSGPSCVGKSPLKHALGKMYPELKRRLKPLVLYDDRLPRPGERDGVDYHFRSRDFIAGLRRDKDFMVMEVRGDMMAVDIKGLKQDLVQTDVFYEGNPFFGTKLLSHPALRTVPKKSVFLSPLSAQEISFFQGLADEQIDLSPLLTEMMRRKLLRRTRHQKGTLSLSDLENIETRARSSYPELCLAWRFEHILVNHDGEDSDHWQAFYYPVGEARQTVMAFADILRGKSPRQGEHWDRDLLGAPD